MADITASPAEPIVTFKKRNTKAKSSVRKRETTPPPSDSDSDFTSSENEEGRQIKRRRRNVGVSASSTGQAAAAVNEVIPKHNTPAVATTAKDDATRASNWYDEDTKNAMHKKDTPNAVQNSHAREEADGTYKGAANYKSFVQTNPDRAPKQVGPVKTSSNVRTITVTDYAPDVCKDYKQTGFCGFGDNCKFLHAREDYKQGWQLDRDWEINTKGKKLTGRTVASADRSAKDGQDEEEDEALLESIPFACIICKQPYKSPIITKCGHYFCESCAIKRYSKDPSCAACSTSTGGTFNVAKKLNKLLDRKREREKRQQEKSLAENDKA